MKHRVLLVGSEEGVSGWFLSEGSLFALRLSGSNSISLLQKRPWHGWLTSRLDGVLTTRRQRAPSRADLSQKDVTLYVTPPPPQ